MGKRELLLILGFLAVGAVVYTLTTPDRTSGSGRSWSSIVEMARREVRGNRASTEVVRTESFPVAAEADELRLVLNAQSMSITGEDRDDIEATLKVWSNGFDDAEADRLANATVLQPSGTGGRLTLDLKYPVEGTQRATVALKVPSRLAVSVSRFHRELTLSGVARAELVETSGDAVVKDVRGRVTATHRGGELTVSDAGEVRLNSRGSDVRLSRIRGDVAISAQGGTITAADLGGPLEIESSGTDFELERLAGQAGQIRATTTGGSLKIQGLAAETRVDARGTDVDLTLARPTTVGIYNEGQSTIEVTPAAGGYTLDAQATNSGQIVVPEGTLEVVDEGEGQRASGAVGGGGPVLTLRTTRGEIVVRERGSEGTTAERR